MAALGDGMLDGHLYRACTPYSDPCITCQALSSRVRWAVRQAAQGGAYLPASSSLSSRAVQPCLFPA